MPVTILRIETTCVISKPGYSSCIAYESAYCALQMLCSFVHLSLQILLVHADRYRDVCVLGSRTDVLRFLLDWSNHCSSGNCPTVIHSKLANNLLGAYTSSGNSGKRESTDDEVVTLIVVLLIDSTGPLGYHLLHLMVTAHPNGSRCLYSRRSGESTGTRRLSSFSARTRRASVTNIVLGSAIIGLLTPSL